MNNTVHASMDTFSNHLLVNYVINLAKHVVFQLHIVLHVIVKKIEKYRNKTLVFALLGITISYILENNVS